MNADVETFKKYVLSYSIDFDSDSILFFYFFT